MTSFDRAVGFGTETTFNQPVARTRFPAFITDGVKPRRMKLEQRGHRAGQRVRPASKIVTQGAAGPVGFEVGTAGLAMFLEHMIGPMTSTGGAGGSTVFTATLGNVAGKGLTYESNRPFEDGSSAVFVATGGKVKSWTLSASMNQSVDLSLDLAFSTWQAAAVKRSATTTSASASIVVTSVVGLTTGMLIRGTGIATNTTISSITALTNTITMSASATATGTAILTFGLDAQEVRTGDLASSITITTTAANTAGIVAGLAVYGPGIQAETYVASVTSTTIVLTKAATITATGQTLVFGIPPTTPSALVSESFAFSETSSTIQWNGAAAGTDYCLVDLKLNGDMGLEDNQTFCGFKEPVAVNEAQISLEATIQWNSWDAYRRYFSDSQAETIAAVTLTFVSATPISAGVYPTMTITMPAVQFEGDMPENTSGILRQPLKGTVIVPSSGNPLTWAYQVASATA